MAGTWQSLKSATAVRRGHDAATNGWTCHVPWGRLVAVARRDTGCQAAGDDIRRVSGGGISATPEDRV